MDVTLPLCPSSSDDFRALIRAHKHAVALIAELQADIQAAERIAKRAARGEQALINELKKANGEDAGAKEVRELLEFARTTLGKGARWYIGPDGKRWKVAKAAIKREGMDRCKDALRGLARKPFAGPRGRSSEQYAGSKRFDDIEYALKDEVTVERCVTYLEDDPPANPVENSEPPPAPPEARVDMLAEARARREQSGKNFRVDPFAEFICQLRWYGPCVPSNRPDVWFGVCPLHGCRLDVRQVGDPVQAPERVQVVAACPEGCDTGLVRRAIAADDQRELAA